MQHDLTPAPRPAHVPPQLVVDFNVYGPDRAASDLHGAWRKLHEGPIRDAARGCAVALAPAAARREAREQRECRASGGAAGGGRDGGHAES